MRTANSSPPRASEGWAVPEFSVDLDALSESLERMDNFQRLSKALLDEIDNTVKNLHVSWQGEAAAAHAQAHQKWTHGAEQMAQALTVLHRSGTGAHRNYTHAAKINRTMWS